MPTNLQIYWKAYRRRSEVQHAGWATPTPRLFVGGRLRPPWMAGVPEMQEHFSGRAPRMAGVPEMQEHFPAGRLRFSMKGGHCPP